MYNSETTTRSYFLFLDRIRKVETLPGAPRLQLTERKLLGLLAAAWHTNGGYTTGAATLLESVGAPATIYRKLARLRDLGLIELFSGDDARRVKVIRPTDRALAYIEMLAACVHHPGETLPEA